MSAVLGATPSNRIAAPVARFLEDMTGTYSAPYTDVWAAAVDVAVGGNVASGHVVDDLLCMLASYRTPTHYVYMLGAPRRRMRRTLTLPSEWSPLWRQPALVLNSRHKYSAAPPFPLPLLTFVDVSAGPA